jgi:hypothetical protein
MNTKTKLSTMTAKIKAKRVAGAFSYDEYCDTANIWTQESWCAQVKIQRRDMPVAEFKALVSKIAELVKKEAA